MAQLAERKDWHSSPDVLKAVKDFHDKYAREPLAALTESKTVHTSIINELASQLRCFGYCQKVEYTGSAYEGIKTGTEIEFDVMFIIDLQDIKVEAARRPGYVYLKKTKPWYGISPFKQAGDYVDPDKLASAFFGLVKQCTDEKRYFSQEIQLRKNGPAVRMKVCRDGKVWYEVDIVPAVSAEGKLYVAKTYAESTADQASASDHGKPPWRMSYSIEEKNAMKDIDKGNGCRKQCARIMKLLRENDSTLKGVPSYVIKTALLHANRLIPSWKQEELGVRLLDLLGLLEIATRGPNPPSLPNFFNGDVNLLAEMSTKQTENFYGRIRPWRACSCHKPSPSCDCQKQFIKKLAEFKYLTYASG